MHACTMRLPLLLATVATLSVCASFAESKVNIAVENDAQKNNYAFEDETVADQDENELAQSMNSLLAQKQQYDDTQDFDDEDLNTLAEMQDEEIEEALRHAFASIQDSSSDKEMDDYDGEESEAMIAQDNDSDDDDQLDPDKAEIETFMKALAEIQDDDEDIDDSTTLAELEGMDEENLDFDNAVVNALMSDLTVEKEQTNLDNKKRYLEEELASIQQQEGDDSEDEDEFLNDVETMEQDSAAIEALNNALAETESEDDDEDMPAALNQLLTSDQAAIIEGQSLSDALSNSKSTASSQLFRRRRRRFRLRRIIRRPIRRIRRVFRRPIRIIRRVFRRQNIPLIRRPIRRIIPLIRRSIPRRVRIVRQPIRKILPMIRNSIRRVIPKPVMRIVKRIRSFPLIRNIVRKVQPKEITRRVLRVVKNIPRIKRIVRKLKPSFSNPPIVNRGKLVQNPIKKVTPLGRYNTGGRVTRPGGKGSKSWLTRLIGDNPNSFLKKMIVIIKKYGPKRSG